MGQIKVPDQVKPIIGVLYHDVALLEKVSQRIEGHFSAVDLMSDPFPFTETTYYDEEMGAGLTRQYFSLTGLIDPTEIVRLKHLTNLWEEEFAQNGQRRINLDPGYISLSNLVLASTKNFSHRIYMGRGIFAEVTLRFEHGVFTPLPWTYPDYMNHMEVLLQIRRNYKAQLERKAAQEPTGDD